MTGRVTTDGMTCSIEGCLKTARSRGWCKRHWTRWSRHGDPTVVLTSSRPARRSCGVDGCDRKMHGNGWCAAHWERVRRVGDVCAPVPLGASPWELRAFLDPSPPKCVDCDGETWGGTIRCEPCLRANLASRVEAKPVGDPKGSGDPGRTPVRQVSTRGVAA